MSNDIKDINFNGHNLPIRQFKLSSMVPNPAIIMVAKRGSGKSWVTRSIIKHFNYIPGGVVISYTDRMSTFYGNFIPDIYVHYEFKTDTIQRILDRQTYMLKKTVDKVLQHKKKLDPRAWLVMDDCLSDVKNWGKDKTIRELLFNGRHYQLMFILTMQTPLGIEPELRGNFDYVFLLATNIATDQEKIYKHYAGVFPKLEFFRHVFMQLTNNYGCMVVVNRECKQALTDNIFWYKAENHENVKIGCSQYRKFHNDNYNKHWEDKQKKFDLNTFIQNKKNIPSVNVELVK